MMLMLAILILGTVHSTYATPFDMQVVLQNAFFESSMVKMIGLGFGSLPSINVPDIPLSTGLWPFLYEIHIKNLRNTSFADVTKDSQQFNVLQDAQMLRIKLPHVNKYVLSYDYEYTSFLGTTKGKGEYHMINMDIELTFGISGNTPHLQIKESKISLGSSKMVATEGNLMKLIAFFFNSFSKLISFIINKYPSMINSALEMISLQFSLPLTGTNIVANAGIPMPLLFEKGYTSMFFDMSFTNSKTKESFKDEVMHDYKTPVMDYSRNLYVLAKVNPINSLLGALQNAGLLQMNVTNSTVYAMSNISLSTNDFSGYISSLKNGPNDAMNISISATTAPTIHVSDKISFNAGTMLQFIDVVAKKQLFTIASSANVGMKVQISSFTSILVDMIDLSLSSIVGSSNEATDMGNDMANLLIYAKNFLNLYFFDIPIAIPANNYVDVLGMDLSLGSDMLSIGADLKLKI